MAIGFDGATLPVAGRLPFGIKAPIAVYLAEDEVDLDCR